MYRTVYQGSGLGNKTETNSINLFLSLPHHTQIFRPQCCSACPRQPRWTIRNHHSAQEESWRIFPRLMFIYYVPTSVPQALLQAMHYLLIPVHSTRPSLAGRQVCSMWMWFIMYCNKPFRYYYTPAIQQQTSQAQLYWLEIAKLPPVPPALAVFFFGISFLNAMSKKGI